MLNQSRTVANTQLFSSELSYQSLLTEYFYQGNLPLAYFTKSTCFKTSIYVWMEMDHQWSKRLGPILLPICFLSTSVMVFFYCWYVSEFCSTEESSTYFAKYKNDFIIFNFNTFRVTPIQFLSMYNQPLLIHTYT